MKPHLDTLANCGPIKTRIFMQTDDETDILQL